MFWKKGFFLALAFLTLSSTPLKAAGGGAGGFLLAFEILMAGGSLASAACPGCAALFWTGPVIDVYGKDHATGQKVEATLFYLPLILYNAQQTRKGSLLRSHDTKPSEVFLANFAYLNLTGIIVAGRADAAGPRPIPPDQKWQRIYLAPQGEALALVWEGRF